MVLNSEPLWTALSNADGQALLARQSIEGFLTFLTDCTHLRTFGLAYNRPVQRSTFNIHPAEIPLARKCLASCFPGPVMQGCYYNIHGPVGSPLGSSENLVYDLNDFISGVHNLELLLRGLGPAETPPDGLQGMKIGCQKLKHLHIQAILPADPELHHGMKRIGRVQTEL
jgi:hypothetical protein